MPVGEITFATHHPIRFVIEPLLYCTLDKSVEPGAFLNMFKAQGDNPVVEIECDHEGLFTDPKVYTDGLIRCIEA